MPPKKPSGTEMTRAQGQLMTRKVSAFSTQPAQPGSQAQRQPYCGRQQGQQQRRRADGGV